MATEVVSYQDLAAALAGNTISPRSAIVAAYALCGFAHIASMAIFIGGYGARAPERMRTLSELGFRALAARGRHDRLPDDRVHHRDVFHGPVAALWKVA